MNTEARTSRPMGYWRVWQLAREHPDGITLTQVVGATGWSSGSAAKALNDAVQLSLLTREASPGVRYFVHPEAAPAEQRLVTDPSYGILLTRMDSLEAVIRARDWDETERQFDRVLSQVLRMAGVRGRPYDEPGPAR